MADCIGVRTAVLERVAGETTGLDGSTRPRTVPAVSARWGFPDARRFAAAYRGTYGRLPEETLRR